MIVLHSENASTLDMLKDCLVVIEGTSYTFGPLLWKSSVDQKLCKYLLDVKANIDARKSLAGKIDSEWYFNEQQSSRLFEYLCPYIDSYIFKSCARHLSKEKYTIDEQQLYNSYKLQFSPAWINFQKAKEYNPPHTHGSDISYVLYPSVPEEIYQEPNNTTSAVPGSIDFYFGERTANLRRHDDGSENLKNIFQPVVELNFTPSTGTIFIFPSYLKHFVYAFNNPNVTRVSVSGNVNISQV